MQFKGIKPTILVRGAMTSYSGYGTATMAFIEELDKHVDIVILGIEATQGLPKVIADILQRPLPMTIHMFLEIVPSFSPQGRFRCFSVLYSMIEQGKFTSNIDEEIIRGYDLIVTPNYHSQEAFAKIVGINKVAVVPFGIDTKFFKYRERKLKKHIRFCCVGYMNKRKGIDLTVQAFKEVSKDYNCTLDIHTTGMPFVPEWYKIDKLNIFNRTISRKELLKFYYGHDAMLCSSRGEGFNLPAAEFLSTGGTVVATKWAGHEMFIDEAYAYPLRHKMILVSTLSDIFPEGVQMIDKDWIADDSMWAEPIYEDIVKAMVDICEDREKLKEKMANTSILRDKLNIERVTSELLHTIMEYKVKQDAKRKGRSGRDTAIQTTEVCF